MTFPAQERVFGFSGPMARGMAVGLLMAAVTIFLLSAQLGGWRQSPELIQKLYFLPLLLAAAWFGVPGTVVVTWFITVVTGGLILSNWSDDLRVQTARMGEVVVFWLVGALAANYFEQEKKYVRNLERANENTLLAFASALDLRERDTGLHSQRVANYTVRLASQCGIAERAQLAAIWKGALLHDIGKIGMPDEILLKAGPLSPGEWEMMRRHPEVGYRLIQNIEFLRDSAEIVLSHHERFDGTGYPRGLRGERIPLGAKLFAVIDAYDALTTTRLYHSAISHESAVEILEDDAGKHFDPKIVEAFKQVSLVEWLDIASASQPRIPIETHVPPSERREQVSAGSAVFRQTPSPGRARRRRR